MTDEYSSKDYLNNLGKATDHVIDAQFPYWGALLTFNAIIIALFGSQIAKSSFQILTFILVCIGLLSSLLIVINFRSRINFLKQLATTLLEGKNEQKSKEQVSKEANKQRKNIDLRENIALFFIFIQVCIILWLSFPMFH